MSAVPEWVVQCLGRVVRLRFDLETATGVYQVGYPARLISIQSGYGQGHPEIPYATIALDPHDPTWEENVPFDAIEPVRR
jgi:hypothetical protein